VLQSGGTNRIPVTTKRNIGNLLHLIKRAEEERQLVEKDVVQLASTYHLYCEALKKACTSDSTDASARSSLLSKVYEVRVLLFSLLRAFPAIVPDDIKATFLHTSDTDTPNNIDCVTEDECELPEEMSMGDIVDNTSEFLDSDEEYSDCESDID